MKFVKDLRTDWILRRHLKLAAHWSRRDDTKYCWYDLDMSQTASYDDLYEKKASTLFHEQSNFCKNDRNQCI